MPVQVELVQRVTQSARLSKDQGPLSREVFSLVSLTHVKPVAPVCAGHTSPLLYLSSPHLSASFQENPQGNPGGYGGLLFPMLKHEADKKRLA